MKRKRQEWAKYRTSGDTLRDWGCVRLRFIDDDDDDGWLAVGELWLEPGEGW